MKLPKLKSKVRTIPPWHMYVLIDGRWRRKEFDTYPQAFNNLIKRVKDGRATDGAIHSRGQWFSPPVVKVGGRKTYWPMPPGHRWCGLCRRPVVLQYFSSHHAFPRHHSLIPYELRCTICGARSSMAPREYPSVLRSQFA
jgi:hypothetical protein